MEARWIGIPATALMIISAGQVLADEALANKSGCLECHNVDKSVDKKVVGPTFHDIAAKYRGNATARNALIQTVKKGGKGNWPEVSGGIPMPPYSPRLSDTEIQNLVDWMLRL
jgi:cytochrome c